MNRLLVVDNEPNIVRGIKLMLEEEAPYDLDIYGVYSSEEALRLLGRMKIDIALLDIRMPGMNGLELQESIIRQWPHCQVIFLTGYDDFTYVQAALRGGSVDYILKTDGDEAIIQAIGKALNVLSHSLEADRLMEQARQKVLQSISALQKEWIQRTASGLTPVRQKRLDELNIPLLANRGALTVIARIDSWPAHYTEEDRELMDYAIQNIAGEYWAECRIVISSQDTGTLIAFLQSREAAAGEEEAQWTRYVHGQLELIQNACKQYLHLSVSFAAGSRIVPWPEIADQFAELRQLLFFGFGQRSEMLLTDHVKLNFDMDQEGDRTVLKASSKLKQLLAADLGSECLIRREFAELAELSRGLLHNQVFLYEMYNGLAYFLLSTINQHAKWSELTASGQFDKLYSLNSHDSWEEALQYLQDAIERLLSARDRESEADTHALVTKLKSHIETHLDEELSLVRLSEIVYLNPTYLSRLFKQQAGQGISQYITELRLNRAKALLLDSRIKIYEVALKVGFDSATSFGRFFKRELNMTPQEYRDRG